MMGGRLVHGKHFQAGCLGGHFAADYRGRRCSCGGVGCVESESAAWALPLICAAHRFLRRGALAALPHIGYEDLFRLAASGDVCASEVRDGCIHVWSVGAVSLIHAYDPELLILGGGVMNSRSRSCRR